MSASGHDGSHERVVGEDLLRRAMALVQPGEIERWDDPTYLRGYSVAVRRSRSAAHKLEVAAAEAMEEARRAEVQRRRIERTLAVALRRADIEARKAAGGFYCGQRRSPNRPTHVDVDPEAWTTVKRRAIARGLTVGEVVGGLVANASKSTLAVESQTNSHRDQGRRAKRFARLFVSDDAWQSFRAVVADAETTVARAVGIVVETEARRIGSMVRPR